MSPPNSNVSIPRARPACGRFISALLTDSAEGSFASAGNQKNQGIHVEGDFSDGSAVGILPELEFYLFENCLVGMVA